MDVLRGDMMVIRIWVEGVIGNGRGGLRSEGRLGV